MSGIKSAGPPFVMEIEDARGDITSVRGAHVSGGITKSGTGYTLTFSGGPGRSSVSIWLPVEHAAAIARSLTTATTPAATRAPPGRRTTATRRPSMATSETACIFCRNHDMSDECWHSVEYEYVARALAVACTGADEPTDEQVGWYVDEAEDLASDLRDILGRNTPLTARVLPYMPRRPDRCSVLFNERVVVTLDGSNDGSGEVATDVVADLKARL